VKHALATLIAVLLRRPWPNAALPPTRHAIRIRLAP